MLCPFSFISEKCLYVTMTITVTNVHIPTVPFLLSNIAQNCSLLLIILELLDIQWQTLINYILTTKTYLKGDDSVISC